MTNNDRLIDCEWLSVMTTDADGDVSKYVRKLQKHIEWQDYLLRINHKFKRNYIKYLQELNNRLFAENRRLRDELGEEGVVELMKRLEWNPDTGEYKG